MAVISITITDSELELLAGIPQQVTVEVSIPSTVFYTLDGTDPDTNSTVYVDGIVLPTTGSVVTLKLYATNGSDSSVIVTQTYGTNFTGLRQAHDQVTNAAETVAETQNLYPFGGFSSVVPAHYGNTAGITVDSDAIDNINDGYDADGYAIGGTDQALSEYQLIYSTSNYLGETGHGIGTLPANVQIRVPTPEHPSTSSNINSRLFNPKAMVIYQDSSDDPIDPNAPQLNTQFFSMENPEKVRTGALLFNTALDGLQPTGSFVRAYFNPTEQKIIYYYFDSATTRWIISKEPYQPSPTAHNLSNVIISSRNQGAGYIYKWLPFVGRKLI